MNINDVYGSIYRGNYGWWSQFKDRWAGSRAARRSRNSVSEDRRLEDFPFYAWMMHGEKGAFATFLKALRKVYDELEIQYRNCRAAIQKNETNTAIAVNRAKNVVAEKKRAQHRYDELGEKLRRALKVPTGKRVTVPILVGLAFVEWPLNWLAVQAVINAEPWIAAIAAAILGGVLVFAAFLLGRFAKRALVGLLPSEALGQSVHDRYMIAALNAIGFVAVAIFIGIVIYDVGQIRQAFVDGLAANQPNEDAFFSSQMPSILSGETHVPLRRDGWFLIDLNAALLFVGAFLSFTNCESVAAYEEAKKAVERAEIACKAQEDELTRLRHERTDLNELRQRLEGALKLPRGEAYKRRGVRTYFVMMRLGHFRDGYESVANGRVPQALNILDIDVITKTIATDEDIDELFPDEWVPPNAEPLNELVGDEDEAA